jgi:signal transduction histidine kinase
LSGDGARLGAVVAFEDISEQKAAAKQREQTAQFQEQFIGILGHDLRSPLSAIAMSAALLAHQMGKDNPIVRRITASSDRIKRMIDQLLDLTRTRLGGGLVLAPRLVNLSDIVRNVVDEVQISRPGCVLNLQSPPVCMGSWDESRLEQVLSNLINNAVLYGRPGRPIDIRLEIVSGEAVCEVHNENPESGEIPPELRAVLFEPFRRGQNDYQPSQGLGLGLFIAKEIVTAHRGRIEVRSTRDEGTTFRIRLPMAEQREET